MRGAGPLILSVCGPAQMAGRKVVIRFELSLGNGQPG